ncbi:MAG TPA: hypothetical protein VFG55_04700 [Rhodanobacteraceae bacterium]|nr:hypothetical protein [Rhodanobacteraceae bacterium]
MTGFGKSSADTTPAAINPETAAAIRARRPKRALHPFEAAKPAVP